MHKGDPQVSENDNQFPEILPDTLNKFKEIHLLGKNHPLGDDNSTRSNRGIQLFGQQPRQCRFLDTL